MTTTKVTFDSEKLLYATELMRALAHPLRLKIIEFIDKRGSINVNKIYRSLGIEQSITSQHLKVLRLVDVVHSEKQGKYVLYSLNYDRLEKASKGVSRFVKAEKALYSKES